MNSPLRHACAAILPLTMGFALLAVADDQPYTTEAFFIGGAGSTSTNGEYVHVSSWRQLTQTSLSSGGPYNNASGFLGAVSDASVPFQILSFRFSGGTAPHFEITIPTQPGGTYVIQFADSSGTTFAWQPFLNTNQAVGTYVETNTVPSNFTFTDDFTPATSGGSPTSQARFYRVMAVEPGTAP